MVKSIFLIFFNFFYILIWGEDRLHTPYFERIFFLALLEAEKLDCPLFCRDHIIRDTPFWLISDVETFTTHYCWHIITFWLLKIDKRCYLLCPLLCSFAKNCTFLWFLLNSESNLVYFWLKVMWHVFQCHVASLSTKSKLNWIHHWAKTTKKCNFWQNYIIRDRANI